VSAGPFHVSRNRFDMAPAPWEVQGPTETLAEAVANAKAAIREIRAGIVCIHTPPGSDGVWKLVAHWRRDNGKGASKVY
jgi:hypothetical protein